jgi:hypothetical protein
MPCCALAACIVGQLLLAIGVVRGALFGGSARVSAANPAVEWRLDPGASPATSRLLRPERPARWSRRAVAAVVTLEVAIVLGLAYGVVEHLGHRDDPEHAGHAHRTERSTLASSADLVDPGAATGAHPAHD